MNPTQGELYELVGGTQWRFPIYVQWVGLTTAEVTIAEIPILKLQRATVEEALRVHSTHHEHGKYYFTKPGLARCAFKSRHEDPEAVVIWNHQAVFDAKVDDFAAAYASSRFSMIRDPERFAIFWNGLRRFMLDWLIFHERPLDLGFCRLDAFVARANWKNWITSALMGKRYNSRPANAEAIRRETRKLLHQSKMTAFDETLGTIKWSLDVTPLPAFNAATHKIETKRKLSRKGSYLWHVLQHLRERNHKNRLYENLLAYTRETKSPYPALPLGFEPRHDGNGKESPINIEAAPKWTPTPVVAGKKKGDKTGRAVVFEDACVPKVSDLEQLAQDLWDGGGDVDTTGAIEAEAGGMSMLFAFEKPTGQPNPDFKLAATDKVPPVAGEPAGEPAAGESPIPGAGDKLLAGDGNERPDGMATPPEQPPGEAGPEATEEK